MVPATTVVGDDGAVYQITLEPAAPAPPPAAGACVCPLPELMCRGCRCGAFDREMEGRP